MLRAEGTDATSVSDVMQAAGLTHGGFYRHFKSKDELVSAAFRKAVDDVLKDMEQAPDETERSKARRDYIDTYLSKCHVDNRGDGCPLAALANDLSRGEEAARHEGLAAFERVSGLLKTDESPAQGKALLALMVGTVTLARLAEAEGKSESILEAGRTAAELLERNWPTRTQSGKADQQQGDEIGVADKGCGMHAARSLEIHQDQHIEACRQTKTECRQPDRAMCIGGGVKTGVPETVRTGQSEPCQYQCSGEVEKDQGQIHQFRFEKQQHCHNDHCCRGEDFQEPSRPHASGEASKACECDRRQRSCKNRNGIANNLDPIAPAQSDQDRLQGAKGNQQQERLRGDQSIAAPKLREDQYQQHRVDEGQGDEQQENHPDPVWRAAIDPERVGSLGFSLGGAAVLRMVGALATVEAYARYCETYPDMADCRWFKGGRAYRDGEEIKVGPFDLRSVDRVRFEQREQEPRIRAIVAVDPALAAVFDPASLEPIDIPLHFINLGLPKTIPIAVKSDELAERAPSGSLDHVAGAVHFSFLPECAPGAADFLKRIGDTDELCADGGGRPRAELHQELADKILRVLHDSLPVGK
eukprot:g2206.t1